MDSLTAGTLNVTNITKCILELVSNSLNANATSIAIRIHAENRKIQVIDNGIGISKKKLKILAEYNDQIPYNYWNVQDVCNLKKQTILNIRKLSDSLLIISRHCNSSKTYMKIFKVYQNPKIVKTQGRPSHGTTVSIHGFHELSLNKWNLPLMCNLIANVAIANPQVSISIRDDQEQKVILIITKPHNPTDIFKLLYKKEVILHNTWYIQNMEELNVKFCAYVGLSDTKTNATQHVFLNNKLVHCPLILKVTSATFIDAFSCFAKIHCRQALSKKTVFVLIFVTCTDYIFAIEHGKKTLILPSIQELLQNIRKEILNIFTKNVTPLFDNIPGHVKKHKNLPCNYTNKLNTAELLKNVSIPQLSLSQKSRRRLTIYNVKRKVTKLKISQTRKNNESISKVTSINQLRIDNFITKEKLCQDSGNTVLLTTNKIIDITPISQDDNVNKELTMLSPYEWSDWSYSGKKSCNIKKTQTVSRINHFRNNFMEFYKRFDFLPEKLHKQLRGNIKLTKIDILKELENDSTMKLKSGLKSRYSVHT
nr:PREDICTED: uncharacterized protein LOC105663617 [Megachile rotundata]